MNVDTYDPEAGPPDVWDTTTVRHLMTWPPLMEWISEAGVNPSDVRSFTVAEDGWSATFTILLLDPQGGRYRIGRRYRTGHDGEIATRLDTVPITSLPPYMTPLGTVIR